MRACRAIAIATTCFLVGCSLLTTWDGLTGAKNTGGTGSTGTGTVSAAGTGSATGTGSGAGGDAGTDAPPAKCQPGGRYCGTDKLAGNSDTLYLCNPDGTGTTLEVCMYGCIVRPGQDDTCHCTPGGAYCGGDKLDGNLNSLYRCHYPPDPPTLIMQCPNKCQVNAGADDTCV